MATQEQWNDLAALLQCAGSEDDEGTIYIMSRTPDPAWIIACLASALYQRLGDDRDRVIAKMLAGDYEREPA
jgi:hypothetical protein